MKRIFLQSLAQCKLPVSQLICNGTIVLSGWNCHHRLSNGCVGLLFGVMLVSGWLLSEPAVAEKDSAGSSQGDIVQGTPGFSRDIRPILSNKCFTCHGPDEGTRNGGFRLDVKESVMTEADSGETPIVPGDLDASELWRRINSDDPDEVMPPPGEEKQLTNADRELLKQWIAADAPWEEHWSFAPVTKPDPPVVKSQDSTTGPIDNFVLAKLESAGRQFSPLADKATLIRRLSLDLTGLPPTPEDVTAFLDDDSKDAYERVVDRLLASPHYGEHMATSWLDAARFADTNGYQNDFKRSMWPWRDWVISAFNENLPYDQFAIEQLAGDLLEDPTNGQITATGFNRNHRTVTEAGSINEEWLVENIVDRIETTSAVFLGLTMGCARCHDHKYDPVSQEEFYGMFAYFNSIDEKGVNTEQRGNVAPLHMVLNKEEQKIQDAFTEKIGKAKADIASFEKLLGPQQTEWEESFSPEAIEQPEQLPNDAAVNIAVPGVEIQQAEVKSAIKSPSANDIFPEVVAFDATQSGVITFDSPFQFESDKPFSISVWAYAVDDGVILSRMDEKNKHRGMDLVILDDFRIAVHLIHEFPMNFIKITTREKLPMRQWNHISVVYDGSKKAAGVRVYLNTQLASTNLEYDSLTGETNTDHPIWLGHRSGMQYLEGQLGYLQLFDREIDKSEIDAIFASSLVRARSVAVGQRTREQQSLIDHVFREHFAVDYAGARNQLSVYEHEQAAFHKDKQSVMVMKELPEPRDTFVLQRGQYDKPDKSRKVNPGVPAFLPQPSEGTPSNRLGLARWIVSRDNPLASRVAVNRIWQQLFGVGIVESSENFGIQCPPPLHTELLDWLATEFMDSGWDIKSLIKTIVMSATYRQSSAFDSEFAKDDPMNQWLGRGARYRLTSEAIRDNALAASGLLARDVGGPSVKPYQPDGIWDELAGGAGEGKYVQDTDKNLYRRSLYIYRKRTVPHPTMVTFDAPSREICQVARQRTNTPLQALALLNDTTYVEAARQLAVRAMEFSDEPEEQIAYAFRRATCRSPNQHELLILAGAYNRYAEHFSNNEDAAKELTSIGNSKTPEDMEVAPLAALSTVTSTILNLDETISRE